MAQIKTSWRFAVQPLNSYPLAQLFAWLGTMAGWLLILIAALIGLSTTDAEIIPFLASLGVLARTGATISALTIDDLITYFALAITFLVIVQNLYIENYSIYTTIFGPHRGSSKQINWPLKKMDLNKDYL